ncbi:tape measure protein [Acinetobacter baumannii]|uniref:tape measure protein n=3 Tax=Acinetobacter baumannii TaxID=470 RepID=UPI000DE75F21|nr:tape measure protein [Acinetobacter baumannii]MBI1415512.1 tape measure protein [Acinetobacter baumannii]MCJ9178390.1 tape measure protein [Acinetobacter baumannii]MCJ9182399.1 tape measure protein [Acinetobacter baumannii]MCJ9189696.1 tape measure protein [Acinetobacter baumannii]MCJ9196696.1 tape measure protein [Acinetobacter baumannii]
MAQESRLVIVIDAKNAERNARNLGNELDSIERKGDFATKSMDALSVATRQLAGYMAGLVTVSAAISKMDTYTGLQNRLKLVTNNQVELNKATEDTFRIAQKTYSAWDSVLQVYQRFSDNAKTLNLTMDDTARLTETVSKAVAISGASAAAADAALVQFGQALASGTLRGEELNSVMEQTPALAKAIAQGMGITVGELRTVAAEGKITSQEIVKALRNVEKDVDALFAKTDITIGQSMTLLNNEITKFVGESGKGSGAAQVLAGTIQTLASNLDVLTSAMMVGGAYWLGTYIPAIYASGVAVAAKTKELAVQTVTQYAAIQAERAAAAQQVISTQAAVANTQATLAAIAAEKALEVQRLKSQITEKGRTATLTRMAELKKIEAQVTRELAVAEGALATAQARSAAAGAASVGIGSRLLGLLGGPVGIGITVASLAAGYLLMRDNGDKANDMLEKQSRYAGMAADELMKLEGAQKRAAEGELTKQLSLQNAQLSKSQNEFLLLTQSITDSNKQSAEAYRIWAELKTGVIDVNQAFNRLNQLSFISSDQINQLADSKKKVDENTKAVKQTNSELNQVRTSGANAKAGFNDVGQGAKGAGQDVSELNKKLQDLQKTYAQKNLDTDFSLINIKSHGLEMGKALSDFYDNNKIPKTRSLTKDEWAIFQKNFDKVQELKKLEEDIADSKRQQTKELEKQQKVLSVNAKVQANAAKYGFGAIESKYNLPAGTLSALHMIESRGNAKAYNKSTGATGGFQFLEGTAKQYGVKDRTDLAQSAEGAGKYMAYLLKLFKGDLEKAVRAYHAGEGNVQKGKGIGKYNNQYWKDFQGYMAGINGYTAGDITSKDFDKLIQDATKMAEEQAKLRLQLENDVADEVTKIRNDLAKKLEDVDKANFTPERKAEITAQLKARAENDIAIAQQALRTKLDDYKQFNLTEEQLLKESFDRKKFSAAHDIELSKDQRDEAIKYLDQQYQHELELINLTKAARQSAYDQANLKALQELKQERDILAAPIWQRAGLSLQFGERNALSENDATLINKGDEAKMKLKQKEIDQLEYNKRIEDAVRIHEENKFKIQEEYAQKYQDLQQSQHQTQLELYGSLLSQASTVWGSMTEMVKSSAGEQSSAYKAMFLMQQAIAIGQAIISTELAATKALELGPVLGIPASTLVRGMGYASVGLIAAQTIAGFSSGGYTGNMGRGDVAGVVHGQEYVLNAAATKRVGVDTLNAINSGQSFGSSGATVLEPIVNVYVMEGQTADVTRNDDGSLDVRIRQIAGEVAEQVFLQGIQNPNSRISKAFKQNYNATPRRQ